MMRERVARQRSRQIAQILIVVAVVVGGFAAASFVLSGTGTSGVNTSLHQHPHITIMLDGNPVTIPVNIGIDPNLWRDHTMDEYRQMETMSPIHTHDTSGTIHLEMGRWHPCTLGDFFNVWGQPFDRDRVLNYQGTVSMTVNGKPSQDFRDLLLQDGQDIVIRGGG